MVIIGFSVTLWVVTYFINATTENIVDFLRFWKVKKEAIDDSQIEE